MIYFTADLHFEHANIIKFCNRPFDSVESMNKALINNWNSTVSHDDEIYILGDLTGESGQARRFLPALNGKKYMIEGNHDMWLKQKKTIEYHFEWIKNYEVISTNGFRFVLFHYPIVEWDGFYKGSIHLHGHIHNRAVSSSWNASNIRAFNVGVDVNDFKPVSIDEIIKRAKIIPVEKRDN